MLDWIKNAFFLFANLIQLIAKGKRQKPTQSPLGVKEEAFGSWPLAFSQKLIVYCQLIVSSWDFVLTPTLTPKIQP